MMKRPNPPHAPAEAVIWESIVRADVTGAFEDIGRVKQLYDRLCQVNGRWIIDTPDWRDKLEGQIWKPAGDMPKEIGKTPRTVMRRAMRATDDLRALLSARHSGFHNVNMADAALALEHAGDLHPARAAGRDLLIEIETALSDLAEILVLGEALLRKDPLTGAPPDLAPLPKARGKKQLIWHDLYYETLLWVCEVANIEPTLGGGDVPTGSLYRLAEAFEPCLLPPMRPKKNKPHTRLTRLTKSKARRRTTHTE